MVKTFKKIFDILRKIIGAILALIVLINIWFIFSSYVLDDPLPTAFGFGAASVLSGSMEPEFSVGDTVVIKQTDDYEVGDIVIFMQSGSFITHRIIGEEDGLFITQGDANNSPDYDLLSEENIYGEVVYIIGGLGSIQTFFSQPVGIFILLVLGLIIIESPKFFSKKDEEETA